MTEKQEFEKAKKANKGKDMFSPAAGLTIVVPTSEKRAFIHKAELFGVKSRLGDGPCTVAENKKIAMPNGDLAIAGDTFDPLEERFSYGRLASLHARKFFTCDKKTLGGISTKLLDADKKKAAKDKTPAPKPPIDEPTKTGKINAPDKNNPTGGGPDDPGDK